MIILLFFALISCTSCIIITPIKLINEQITFDYHNTKYSLAPACYYTTMNSTCNGLFVFNDIPHNITISYDEDVLDIPFDGYYMIHMDAEVFFKITNQPESDKCKTSKCIVRVSYNKDEIYLASFQNGKSKILYHKFHAKQDDYNLHIWIYDLSTSQQWNYEIYIKNQKVYLYNEMADRGSFTSFTFTYLKYDNKMTLYPNYSFDRFLLKDKSIPIIFRLATLINYSIGRYAPDKV